MEERTLSEIWIYPVKSLGGIRLEKAVVQGKGLQFDRRWMLVDQAGIFLTQRVHHQMALFKLGKHGDHLTVTFRNGDKIQPTTSFHSRMLDEGKWMKARIWDDEVNVIDGYPGTSEWFSQQLGIRCKLVYFPEEKVRRVNPKYAVSNEQVSLADAYPFLIIGQSSLDDLNRRLTQPVPMNRFRPNFVFTGGDPYEEDEWKELSIGDNRFAAVKKSARCKITTVDQSTGEKGTEPLLTLSRYRKTDSDIFFGQNLVAMSGGEVTVGDRIVSRRSAVH